MEPRKNSRIVLPFLFLALFVVWPLPADESQDRRDILRFGLEGDIKGLLNQLVREKNPDFRKEITELFARTTNPNIVQAIVQYALESKWTEFGGIVVGASGKLEKVPLSAKLSVVSLIGEFKWLDAEPLLLTWADGEDKTLALGALRALGRLGSPQAGPKLLEKLKDPETDKNFFGDIYWALGELKYPEAFPALQEALEDSGITPLQKRLVLEALGKMALPEGLPLVEGYLQDPNVVLRAEAVKALGGWPGKEGLGDLCLEALRDPEPAVRLAAAELAERARLTSTGDILRYRIARDPELKVRNAAMKALVALDAGSGKAHILTLLREGKVDFPTWKTALIQALDWPETLEALRILLERIGQDRSSPFPGEIANVYGNRKQSGLETLYLLLLDSPVPGVKATVLRGIVLNQAQGLRGKIQGLLNDPALGPQAKKVLEDWDKAGGAANPPAAEAAKDTP